MATKTITKKDLDRRIRFEVFAPDRYVPDCAPLSEWLPDRGFSWCWHRISYQEVGGGMCAVLQVLDPTLALDL